MGQYIGFESHFFDSELKLNMDIIQSNDKCLISSSLEFTPCKEESALGKLLVINVDFAIMTFAR